MKQIVSWLSALGIAVSIFGCASAPAPMTPLMAEHLRSQPPIRFLLTFDDGPSASRFANPTQSILDDLAHNPVQSGIKSIFFVQTHASGGGGTELGRKIMQRENDEGHLLGFHTATPHHANHRFLSSEELEQSLTDGVADIKAITGAAPTLVRPPFWNYDQRTFAAYRQHGLHILLTDLSANDGKTWGITFSPRRRSNLVRQLSELREHIAAGERPAVNACIPVVVTFHDVNRYTARHMQEYLQILVDSAREVGLATSAKPFYDERSELQRAAMASTVARSDQPVHLPGVWNWIWNANKP
ncbi:polysaccharide deacetylase family protein [Paraherbaspirillum soli]|uniref:Polysaccharide deacetylase family protein n=1 Tax=Paraherbaspirillum soli TaxID=631222 RepID=A0ABW0M417_9BURK